MPRPLGSRGAFAPDPTVPARAEILNTAARASPSSVTSPRVTSLAAHRAQPEELAAWSSQHWQNEALHRVRDATYGEDASQIHTGHGPAVMATLRNLAIGILNSAAKPTSPPLTAAKPRPRAHSLPDSPARTQFSAGTRLGWAFGSVRAVTSSTCKGRRGQSRSTVTA